MCVQLTSDFIYKGGLSFETVDIKTLPVIAYFIFILKLCSKYSHSFQSYFCGINFIFFQNYNIWKLLTICHDYPVPVNKHDSDLNFAPPLTS